MSLKFRWLSSLTLSVSLCLSLSLSLSLWVPCSATPSVIADGQSIKPEVAALIKQSTEAYQAMSSYSVDITEKVIRTTEMGVETTDGRYTLALDRVGPRFCYRDMSIDTGTAAVCNGKTLINYDSNRNQYIEKSAPRDYKGINIVDDVTFEPIGGYLIALMLQGDAYADKDVKSAITKATLGQPVVENGKKIQILHILLGAQEEPYDITFGEDHLISRATLKLRSKDITVNITEAVTNVKINKPIDPAIFIYKPPANALKVDHFMAPQRPGDAVLTPHMSSLHLASFSSPQVPGTPQDVVTLIKQATEAYGKLQSYSHTAIFRVTGTAEGKKIDTSAKFMLAMVRPNKFSFKSLTKAPVAAICDGKMFTDFRAGEYTQGKAPGDLKDLHLDEDDFDPVAGSYLVAHLLRSTAFKDPKILGILYKASVHTGIVVGGKSWDALDFPMQDGLRFVLYFDPTTHLLSYAAAKVPDQDLLLSETFEDVMINKPVPDAAFTFSLPTTAKKVNKLGL